MTIKDLYTKLHSRTYYDKSENRKFRFINNSLFIDRRANIPIVIHMLDGIFYIQTLQQIENESLLRLQINDEDIRLYSAVNDSKVWILE